MTQRKCKWCGEYFTVENSRKNNAVKYCSSTCRHEARKELQRENNRRYRERKQNNEQRGHLLGDSRINEHPCSDFKHELAIIRKEKRRIGI